MGLDARIMAAAEHEWKRRMGFGAYVGAVLRELTRLSPSHFRIVADGEVIELPGFLALVANAGELVPGRLGPRHRIDPADGRLDLIVLGGTHVGHLPHGAAKLMLRTGEQDGPGDPTLGDLRPHRGRSRPADRGRRRPAIGRMARSGCAPRCADCARAVGLISSAEGVKRGISRCAAC